MIKDGRTGLSSLEYLLMASTAFSSMSSMRATLMPICITAAHVSTASFIVLNEQIIVFSASGLPKSRSSAWTARSVSVVHAQVAARQASHRSPLRGFLPSR
jgi:hypothetical protein